MDWLATAREYIEREGQDLSRVSPPATPVLLNWQGYTYLAYYQEIAPEYSKEIILLDRADNPIKEELKKALLELNKGRLVLVADDRLDLEERICIARKVNNKVTEPTADQAAYVGEFSALDLETGLSKEIKIARFYETMAG